MPPATWRLAAGQNFIPIRSTHNHPEGTVNTCVIFLSCCISLLHDLFQCFERIAFAADLPVNDVEVSYFRT